MKTIKTLVKDIQDLLVSEKRHVEETVAKFSASLSAQLVARLANETKTPTLRLSNLGTPARKLWYSIKRPDLGESLSASTRLKFLYGDILEELVLYFAEAAGHKVEDRQKEIDLYGVRGHTDGTIDGELVDIKSASTFSFKKFRDGGLLSDDPFGYITQLSGYGHALGVDRGHFVVVDKTLGHITVDTHSFKPRAWEEEINDKRKMLDHPLPPERCYSDEAETYYRKPTGNRKLGIACSYCAFKRSCWPGLRVFFNGDRPTFYTQLRGTPRGKELDWKDLEE